MKKNRELFLLFILFVLGLSIRLYGFTLFPKFNDEMGEVYWATLIAQGEHFPLVGSNLFSGPIYFYFIALLFKVFGFHYFIPRLVSVVTCAFIVPVMYLIGKNLNSKIAGVVSALLFCFFPAFNIINSRLAWSASLTPSFVAFSFLFLVLMYRNVNKINRVYVFVFFTFLALALQSHPSAIAYGVACGLAFFIYKDLRKYFKKTAFYLGVVLFLVLNSTYIYYNIKTGFGSLKIAQEHSYAFETKISPTNYLKNLPQAITQEYQMARGFVMYKDNYKTKDELNMWLTIAGVLCLIYFIFGVSKFKNFGVSFSLLFLLLSFIILPITNSSYLSGISFRYFVFTFVAFYLVIGYGIERIANLMSSKRPRILSFSIVLLLTLPILTAYILSVDHFIKFYDNPARSGVYTNKRLLKGLTIIKDLSKKGNIVYYPSNTVVEEPPLQGELFLGNSEWQKTQFIMMSDGIPVNYYNVGDLEKLSNDPNFKELYYITIIYSGNKPNFVALQQEELYNALDYKLFRVYR